MATNGSMVTFACICTLCVEMVHYVLCAPPPGLLATGEGVDAIGFIIRHPEVLYNIAVFGLSSAVGQIFIFTTVTNFGPLTCSIITTTRKFFTLLASVVIFGNVLLTRQWVGVALVFLGLGLDVYFGKAKTTSTKPAQTA